MRLLRFVLFVNLAGLLTACATPQVSENYAYNVVHTQRALALFLDGTANNARTRTHVRQLYEIVAARNQPDIIAFYNDGVGGAVQERTGAVTTLGTAAARGISRDIRQAFSFLATHHETYSAPLLTDISSNREKRNNAIERTQEICRGLRPLSFKDTVYLFGFSRGAFTARSLIGLTNWFGGVPDFGYCTGRSANDSSAAVVAIYNLYRAFGLRNCHRVGAEIPRQEYSPVCRKLDTQLAHLRSKYPPREIEFQFVGLWDTVRTIGSEAIVCAINDKRTGKIKHQHDFHRGEDFRRTNYVFHAIAAHEKRDCYNLVPLQITKTGYQRPKNPTEIWFAGDHSDIGGGHPAHKGLSGLTMKWMLDNLYETQSRYKKRDRTYTSLLPRLPDDFLYSEECAGYGNLSGDGIFKIMGIAVRKHDLKMHSRSKNTEKAGAVLIPPNERVHCRTERPY